MKIGIKEEEEDVREVQTITAPITKIAQGVVEGNSHTILWWKDLTIYLMCRLLIY